MLWFEKRRLIRFVFLTGKKVQEVVGEHFSLSLDVFNVTDKVTRYGDKLPPVPLTNFAALATRTADQPVELPPQIPGHTTRNSQPRWTDSSIYPYLETNVDVVTMEYTQEPISGELSARTIELHGEKL
jgi:hypothetical protein